MAATPTGLQLLTQAQETVQRVELEALADISSDDKQLLHRLLKQLLAGRLNAGIESGSCL